jgi:hypothetical protein
MQAIDIEKLFGFGAGEKEQRPDPMPSWGSPPPPRRVRLLDVEPPQQRSLEEQLDEDLRRIGTSQGPRIPPATRSRGAASVFNAAEVHSFERKPSQRLYRAPQNYGTTFDTTVYRTHVRSQFELAGTEGACTGFGMAAAWYFLSNTAWASVLAEPGLSHMSGEDVRRLLRGRYMLQTDMDIEFLEELGRIVYFGMLQRSKPEAYQRNELPWVSAQNELSTELFGTRFEIERRKEAYGPAIRRLQRAPIAIALPSHLGVSQILAYSGDELYVTRHDVRSSERPDASRSRFFLSERRHFDPRGFVPSRLSPERLSGILFNDLDKNIERFKDVIGPELLRGMAEVVTGAAAAPPLPTAFAPPSPYDQVSKEYAVALARFMATEFGRPEAISSNLWDNLPFAKKREALDLLTQMRLLIEARGVLRAVPQQPFVVAPMTAAQPSPQLQAMFQLFEQHAERLLDQLVSYSATLKVAEIDEHQLHLQEAQVTINGISAVIEQAVALQHSPILRALANDMMRLSEEPTEATLPLVHAPFAIVFSRNQAMTSCLFKDGHPESPWILFDSHGSEVFAGHAKLLELRSIDALHSLFEDTATFVANIYILTRDERLVLDTTHKALYQDAFLDPFVADAPDQLLPYVWSSN